MSELASLIKKYGMTAKLKREVMRRRGWRAPPFGVVGRNDWYDNWPELAAELVEALKELDR